MLSDALTTPTRKVSVQPDEEHNRFLLNVDDRSNGYPRHHKIGVDFVSGAEYRTLVANRRDMPAFSGDIVISGADVPDETDTAGESEPTKAAKAKPADVTLRSLDEL